MPSVSILGTRGFPSYYGGFETAVRKLAPYLADKGWDVTVYGRPNSVQPDSADRDYRVKSVNTFGIDSKTLSTLSFGFTSALVTMYRKPDVALIMNVANGFWLPLLKLRGIPTVVNVDGIEWERQKWGRNAKRMFKLGARMSAIYGNYLIADATAIKKRWEVETHRKLEFIPYGGDSSNELPAPEFIESGKYALFVARLVPENSVEEFLEAARIIARTHDVVIVGSSGYDDPIEKSLKQISRANDRVKWLGHVSDDELLHGLWQHAGVYFHGHSVGGTNPALVQAMACSAPTVARDTIFNREVLGDGALFVNPNPAEIADTCMRVINDTDLSSKLSKIAFNRSRELYSWESVCRKYANLLKIASLHGSRLIKL